VLSHADFDHVSAATELVTSYEVREVLTGARFVEKENPQSQQLVEDLEKLERPPRILLPGQRNPFGKDTNVEVLWPPSPALPDTASTKTSSNDGCLVFRLTHAGKTILFPGDIQDGAMRELLKNPEKLKADVLIAMHHGSAESLTQKFIDAVDPKWIVSSNDRTLTNKQRNFERLTGGRTLLRTNESGAITISIDAAGNLSVEPFVKQR
jgi:beta-lactamase superfamily II metal-dependent hydrolase